MTDENEDDDEFEPLQVFPDSVPGQGPDGMMYGVSLQMGGWASLDVVLSGSLGTRSLLDASTGEVVPRVERRSDGRAPGEGNGTPLWRWS